MLEWLTNPENMEMDDAIERVNKRMFERMLGKVESLAVFFCKSKRLYEVDLAT